MVKETKIKSIKRIKNFQFTGDIEIENTHSYQLSNGVVSHNSVLLKTASGIHPEHAPMYLRTAQMNKESEVAQLLKKTNPHMVEDSVWSANKTDYAISFPVISPKGSIFKDDLLGVKHLELVRKAQKFWVEEGTNVELCVEKSTRHNISNTIVVDDWDAVEEYVFENRDSFSGVSFLAMSGDKDYVQAPFTKVIDAKEITKTYGNGGIFASGLVVDALKAFNNDLWAACATANGFGEDITSDDNINLLKKDWVRRFIKFSKNHFKDDLKKAEYCLKDVYNLHKWEKIQQNLVDIDWINELHEKKFIDISTTGSAACVGGSEEGCFV
jgi:ribonucleoside-diphosphate reductase alpha chain